jgi:type IV pilus assembly protein PilX
MTRLASYQVPSRQDGAALVVGLILLLVLTVLGITGVVTAALELQMSGNTQFQERAFQAAEFAIEQAVNSPSLSTTNVYTNKLVVPASGSNPTMPSSTSDNYKYSLYYDSTSAGTPVPGGGYSIGSGLEAYHFVVESTGASARGAQDIHTQSFYILGPAGS